MKTLWIFLLVVGFNSGLLFGGTWSDPEKPTEAKSAWVKSEKGIWQGGYTLWYKFEHKTREVRFSHNRKKWRTAPNAAWQDKQGNWLFIYEEKLMTNADGAWTEVKEKSWQDLSGRWYRFNPDWKLEEMTAQVAQNQNP
jgi:hypothetical protein